MVEWKCIASVRVVHLITDLSAHGAQMMLYKLLSRTDRTRFEPVVISMRGRGPMAEKIEALGVPVYDLKIRQPLPGPRSIGWLIYLVRRLRPDLIQGWMYHANLAAQVAKSFSRQNLSVIWSVHHSLYSLSYEKSLTAAIIKVSARLSKLPDKTLYVSKTSAQQHEIVGYTIANRVVVPIGFDIHAFIPSIGERISVRAELGVSKDAFLIGLIGRYHPMKDHTNFLTAASILIKTHPTVQFVLAGENVDTRNRTLLGLLNRLGVSTKVHLLGERRDIPRITAALDVATSSSFSEGFPNAVGEAMACGVPCVVTDVGDSRWILGDTGHVVPPRDSAALARAWQDLIEIGDEGRRSFGKKARDRVVEKFSLEAVVGQYERLYEQVTALNI